MAKGITILYQCPYCKATMCDMEEPCNGCEIWAEALSDGKIESKEI